MLFRWESSGDVLNSGAPRLFPDRCLSSCAGRYADPRAGRAGLAHFPPHPESYVLVYATVAKRGASLRGQNGSCHEIRALLSRHFSVAWREIPWHF